MDRAEWEPQGRTRTCVIGVDAGGSHLRCVVATIDGTVVARGTGAGGNLYSSGPDAVGNLIGCIAGTVSDAGLEGGDQVARVFVAAAGPLSSQSTVQAQVVDGLSAAGIEAPIDWASDVAVIAPGATTNSDVIVASVGTGSIFARITGFEPSTVIGGHGWLVGDEGSAVSIGIGALRHAFAVLDGIAPAGVLFERVIEEMTGPTPASATRRNLVTALTSAVYGRPPAALGALAPMVVEAIDHDPAARSIATEATEAIVAALGHLHPDGDVIVTAGSIAAGSHRLGDELRAAITAKWPDSKLIVGTDGAVGAAAFAIARHRGSWDAATHQHLLAAVTEPVVSNSGAAHGEPSSS